MSDAAADKVEEEFTDVCIQVMTDADRDLIRKQLAAVIMAHPEVIGVHIDGHTWCSS